MKTLLISAAAVVAVAAIAPALAQNAPSAPPPHQPMQMHAITRDQVAQMVQKHFARLDTNHDGYITKAETDAAETSMHQKMEQHDSAMFDRLDTNKDGSISRAEFDAAHQAMAGHMGDGKHMGQGNQTGMHPMAAMQGMHGGMLEHMFATADANKDGRVSLQEATAAALAHFDSADTNHDGSLSPDEMRAAHQAMGGRTGR